MSRDRPSRLHQASRSRWSPPKISYGDIARQIGGAQVAVTSILTNPDQDPHEFEASPSTARAFADAAVIIVNGAGYDGWAEKLLSASPAASRAVVVVAALVHKTAGDNPHVWYDPAQNTRRTRAWRCA